MSQLRDQRQGWCWSGLGRAGTPSLPAGNGYHLSPCIHPSLHPSLPAWGAGHCEVAPAARVPVGSSPKPWDLASGCPVEGGGKEGIWCSAPEWGTSEGCGAAPGPFNSLAQPSRATCEQRGKHWRPMRARLPGLGSQLQAVPEPAGPGIRQCPHRRRFAARSCSGGGQAAPEPCPISGEVSVPCRGVPGCSQPHYLGRRGAACLPRLRGWLILHHG